MKKDILISVEAQEKRVAILEDVVLEEFYIERPSDRQVVGSVYKGKVASVVPGIGAAFVDIGLPKNGFLYVSDIIEVPAANGDEFLVEDSPMAPATAQTHTRERGRGRGSRDRHHSSRDAKIEDLVKEGQEILVQVVKEPLGTKGARLTTHVSLPGRYMVFMPLDHHLGVSKRIAQSEERGRLKTILRELMNGRPLGLIIRTAGQGKAKREFERDVKYLQHLWDRIQGQSRRSKAPVCVYEELDVVLRMVRDQLTEDVNRIVVDSRDEYRRLLHFVSRVVPELRSRVQLYQGDQPLFEKERVDSAIEQLYERKMSLKSGGTIVIESTESLVAIDVNTSRFTGKRNLEETAFQTNIEAAREIARQIRLRDVGGIIIIDFIDMDIPSHRKQIYTTLEESLKRDHAKTNIVSFSELCLIEMTRQRMRRSIERVSHYPCPYCQGRGTVQTPVTVAIRVLRQIKRFFQESKARDIEVFVHPQVATRLLREDRASLSALEQKFRAKILIMSEPNQHLEEIKIVPA